MEQLTWEMLGTTAGAATAVSLLTQIIKHFLPIDPKWIALGLALVILIGVQLISGDFAPASFLLSVFNALVATGTSVGVYETFLREG